MCIRSVLSYLEGKSLQYGRLVEEEQFEIQKVLNELASLSIAEDVKRPYREFVVATQQLLDAIADSHGNLGVTELESE